MSQNKTSKLPRIDLLILPDGRQFLFEASRPDIKVQVSKPNSPNDFVWSRAFEMIWRKLEATNVAQ